MTMLGALKFVINQKALVQKALVEANRLRSAYERDGWTTSETGDVSGRWCHSQPSTDPVRFSQLRPPV